MYKQEQDPFYCCGRCWLKYNPDGNVTNFNELQFAPNDTKQYLQDYISRQLNTPVTPLPDWSKF